MIESFVDCELRIECKSCDESFLTGWGRACTGWGCKQEVTGSHRTAPASRFVHESECFEDVVLCAGRRE